MFTWVKGTSREIDCEAIAGGWVRKLRALSDPALIGSRTDSPDNWRRKKYTYFIT